MPLTPNEAATLINAIRALVDTPAGRGTLVPPPAKPAGRLKGTDAKRLGDTVAAPDADNMERLYQVFKARLIEELRTDAELLQVVTMQSELVNELERHR